MCLIQIETSPNFRYVNMHISYGKGFKGKLLFSADIGNGSLNSMHNVWGALLLYGNANLAIYYYG